MSLRAPIALLVVVVAVGAGYAQDDSGTPHVYTNADLAALEPLPVQDAPLAAEPLDWRDVQDFIAEHHARLAAARRDQLEREFVEQTFEQPAPGWGLALAPWTYVGHGKSRARRIFETTHTDYANRIVPLHARVPLTPWTRPRTGRGADAVPQRPLAPRGSGRNVPAPPPGSARGPAFPTATRP